MYIFMYIHMCKYIYTKHQSTSFQELMDYTHTHAHTQTHA